MKENRSAAGIKNLVIAKEVISNKDNAYCPKIVTSILLNSVNKATFLHNEQQSVE